MTKIRISSSKDDKCMRNLVYLLQTQYKDIHFDLEIGYTSIIYILSDDSTEIKNVDAIKTFCDGYTSGWEDRDDRS
jgi:hypothetical protein